VKPTLTVVGKHGSANISNGRKSLDDDMTRELVLVGELLRTHLNKQSIMFIVHYLLTRISQEEMLANAADLFRKGEQAVIVMSPLGEINTMSVRDFLAKVGVENAENADLSGIFNEEEDENPYFMDDEEDENEDEGPNGRHLH
jgi:hypothetical protein